MATNYSKLSEEILLAEFKQYALKIEEQIGKELNFKFLPFENSNVPKKRFLFSNCNKEDFKKLKDPTIWFREEDGKSVFSGLESLIVVETTTLEYCEGYSDWKRLTWKDFERLINNYYEDKFHYPQDIPTIASAKVKANIVPNDTALTDSDKYVDRSEDLE